MQALLADADTGFVFAGLCGAAIDRLDAVMRSICAKLDAEKATPHDLRRTFSTTVTGLGFGQALNRVTNHKEGSIASVYDRQQYADEIGTLWKLWRRRSWRWRRAGLITKSCRWCGVKIYFGRGLILAAFIPIH